MDTATFAHCKNTYSEWSDEFLFKAFDQYDRLKSDAQAALKEVMSIRGIWPADGDKKNPNWPSTTGNPSGKERGNNPPKDV